MKVVTPTFAGWRLAAQPLLTCRATSRVGRFLLLILAVLLPVARAGAFTADLNGSGNVRRWSLLTSNPNVSTNVVNPSTKAIRFFLASDGFSTTNTAAELNALRAAFGQWQAVPNTHLKFEEAGLTAPPPNLDALDNKNVVYWAKTNTLVSTNSDISGALGYTLYSTLLNKTMLEADIVFNGVEYHWFTDLNNPVSTNVSVEAVALHEIGHLIGLSHSPVGGATMLWGSSRGPSVQLGLSPDDVAAAQYLYPVALSNYGSIKGTVTRAGSPILGATVFAQDTAANVVQGTVTRSDGSYLLTALPPGNYQVRVSPLDPSSATRFLIRGWEIGSSFSAAETRFLPTTNIGVTVTANATNTVNVVVLTNEPAFRISEIRRPSASSGSFSWSRLPTSMRVGQSNYYIGVASTNLPTSSATLTISGDGLTLGATLFNTITSGATVLRFLSVPISVSSNATAGLRDFIVTQGTNVAYANGFLDLQPAVTDDNFDGLDDAFQRAYFPVFTAPAAAPGTDFDGDTFNNYAEYIAGSNPTNAASYLKIQSVTTAGNGTTVRWPSAAGKRYQVSFRTNLFNAPWQNTGAPVVAGGDTAQYLHPGVTNGTRFYRVQALP